MTFCVHFNFITPEGGHFSTATRWPTFQDAWAHACFTVAQFTGSCPERPNTTIANWRVTDFTIDTRTFTVTNGVITEVVE